MAGAPLRQPWGSGKCPFLSHLLPSPFFLSLPFHFPPLPVLCLRFGRQASKALARPPIPSPLSYPPYPPPFPLLPLLVLLPLVLLLFANDLTKLFRMQITDVPTS